VSGHQPWREIDTGLQSAATNIAWDRTLLELRSEGVIPNTLRFLRYTPTALVGYHQSLNEELRLDYCRKQGIEINRRVTGGGAIYFDEPQLGWELIFDRRLFGATTDMATISQRICEAAAEGLRGLGIEAAFRPRNDIEVEGRKISGTGGAFDGDAVLFQGTLLIDFDVEALLKALRVPTEKLNKREITSARERVVSVKDLLGHIPDFETVKEVMRDGFRRHFGIDFTPGELTAAERERFKEVLPEIEETEWVELVTTPEEQADIPVVYGVHKVRGGLLRARLALDLKRRTVRSAMISGDFFIHPKRFVFDLEAALRDCPLDQVEVRLDLFFAGQKVEMLLLSHREFREVILKALDKLKIADRFGLSVEETRDVMLWGNQPMEQTLREATVMLVPYCAKPTDCEWRHKDGCDECGRCAVGDAYRMGRERGMKVITVINYEQLGDTLDRMKQEQVPGYVGMCCEAFFIKRQKAFRDADLPAVLLDIEGATCYELREEDKAYAGTFEAFAGLKLPIVEKVMAFVPPLGLPVEEQSDAFPRRSFLKQKKVSG